MPYLSESRNSYIGLHLPQAMQEAEHDVRIFMPRHGCINERRNQLHEVIRLSGMNIIISDSDHPLIIKVASLQKERLQVYFIDNEEYFAGRGFASEATTEYNDQVERCIFFARGVIETIRKLRWVPDVVYCQGWFASIAPIYIKKAFADDPCFRGAKVAFALYDNAFKGSQPEGAQMLIKREGITKNDLSDINKEKHVTCTDLCKLAVKFSDVLIATDPDVDNAVLEYANKLGKPIVRADQPELDTEFYSQLFQKLKDGEPIE